MGYTICLLFFGCYNYYKLTETKAVPSQSAADAEAGEAGEELLRGAGKK